jgi:hypothetical protein
LRGGGSTLTGAGGFFSETSDLECSASAVGKDVTAFGFMPSVKLSPNKPSWR